MFDLGCRKNVDPYHNTGRFSDDAGPRIDRHNRNHRNRHRAARSCDRGKCLGTNKDLNTFACCQPLPSTTWTSSV